MKIGLVSDTHLPRFGKDLPAVLKQGLIAQRVELILHLGDFTSLAVADLFRRIAPFDAVAGNHDQAMALGAGGEDAPNQRASANQARVAGSASG